MSPALQIPVVCALSGRGLNKGIGNRVGQRGVDSACLRGESSANRVRSTIVRSTGPVNPFDRHIHQRTCGVLQAGGQCHVDIAVADVRCSQRLPGLRLAQVSQAHRVTRSHAGCRNREPQGGCGIACAELHRVTAAGQDLRRVIGAGDGDGQVGRAVAPNTVVYLVGEGVGQSFAHRQGLHRGQGVSDGVGVRTIRTHDQRAVIASHTAAIAAGRTSSDRRVTCRRRVLGVHND